MPQYAVPNNDISDGSWQDGLGGTDLFNQVDNGIDGGTPNDTTYIRDTSGSSTCELSLQSLTDPDDDSNHTIRVRANDFGFNNLGVAVYDGASLVDSTTFSLTNTTTTYSYNLTSYPANYNNLRVRLTASSNFTNVYEVELEVPSAAAGGGGGTTADSVKLGNAGFTFRGSTSIGS